MEREVDRVLKNEFGLTCTDKFIGEIVCRIQDDADPEYNTDDIRIAVRNVLNELVAGM